jgi:hypothetical protein
LPATWNSEPNSLLIHLSCCVLVFATSSSKWCCSFLDLLSLGDLNFQVNEISDEMFHNLWSLWQQ